MVKMNETECPSCGGYLAYYDTVRRKVLGKYRKLSVIKIKRYRCICCGKIHREIPNVIFPYKQYESEIINGVLDGYITSDTLGYEDYPCEKTMNEWSQDLHALL